MSTPTWERVNAGDVRVGDRIARVRTRPLGTVTAIRRGVASLWLTYTDDARIDRIRPRLSAKLWRVVRPRAYGHPPPRKSRT